MKEDAQPDSWYLSRPIPQLMVASYTVMSWALARVDIRRAFLFNAEFEDHAEHTYADLVRAHPEWEEQAARGDLVSTAAAARPGPTSFGASGSTSATI